MGFLLILPGPYYRIAGHPVGANADSENVNKKEAAESDQPVTLGSFTYSGSLSQNIIRFDVIFSVSFRERKVPFS